MKKIPKIAHFYWGSNIMCFLRYMTLYSFRKFNPEWKINLYVPKNLVENISWASSEQKFEVCGKDYMEKVKELNINIILWDMEEIGLSNNLSEVIKSDFLRWYLLGSMGGVWSDMDIVFIKSIENICIGDSNTSICQVRSHWPIGFLLASPLNELFQYIFKNAKEAYDVNKYQSIGTQLFSTLFGTSVDNVRRQFPTLGIFTLPQNVIYPVLRASQAFESMNSFGCDTIGVHWYAGNKLAGEYQNRVTIDNYRDFKGLVFEALKICI